MKKLSIVVPCYNEEATVHPFLAETQKVERTMAGQLVFDYLFVNDGSKDQTLQVLREVSQQFANVHYLSFSRNFGKEAALLAGLEAADGDLITVMDADLQDPPEFCRRCMPKLRKVLMSLVPVGPTARVSRFCGLSSLEPSIGWSIRFPIPRWLMEQEIFVS